MLHQDQWHLPGLTRMAMSTMSPRPVNCIPAQVSTAQVSTLSPGPMNCSPAAQVSSAQVSSAQVSSAQVSSAQVSSAQVSSAQVSSAQVSSAQVSSAQVSSAQVSSAQVSSAQVSSAQVSSAQVSSAQVSSAQVSSAQVSSAQVSTAQVSTLSPARPVDCSPAQMSSAEPLGTSASPGGDAETGVLARRKLARLLMDRLAADKAQFISDRRGITITSDHELKDGTLRFHVEGEHEYVARLYIQNSGSSPVYFTYYSALHCISSYFSLKDEQNVSRSNPLQLGSGASYEIQVLFHSSQVGFYPATLAFEFKADLLPSSRSFHIVRFIEAQHSTSLARELAPTAPYNPRSIAGLTSEPRCPIEDGQRPECPSGSLEHVVALTNYRIPQYVRDLTLLDKHPNLTSHRKEVLDARAMLESPLSRQNYTERFQMLLYLEELQMSVDMKKFNMAETPLIRDQHDQKLIALAVPGVSENRPSLLRGDQLLVRPSGEAGGAGGEVLKYRGYIHRVEQEQVKLGFSAKLLATLVDGMRFSVEFTVNRMTMRLQHRAIDLVSQHSLLEVLFPTAHTSSDQQLQLPTLSLFDRQLEGNPEQYAAVQHIVAQSSKPAPYLVFGPPGTGKTVTVVEAIKQIEKTQGSCHILACAPSNSATDLLCKKIVEHVDKHKVFRMYASSRDPRDVPIQLLGCCNLEGDSFVFPSADVLMQYKIVVTTLLTAGRLVTGGVPPGHFTHIFVDEAGQAMETECILPLAGLLQTTSTQLVLAGDPNQLGPIVRSPLAMKHGMTLSLLERLMKHVDLYLKNERGEFAKPFVTKLLRNYRSHPAILNIPNELFYEGELQVFANEITRNSYCRWEHLPKMDFPVIFHGVTGIDVREANSPSFFNVAEVQMLMDYLKKILETQGKNGLSKIEPKDIGIVAPYRKQVEKIRKALKSVENSLKIMNMKDLKVGSVEEFQGQERKVILVSTVRSSPKYVELDQQFSLGFVKNVKRFNVTLTRAKALLIVVGNPRVLKTDPTWARFIQYCSDEGGYAGFPHTEDDEEEVVSRLADLYIHMQPKKVATEESVVQLQPAPEWRNEH